MFIFCGKCPKNSGALREDMEFGVQAPWKNTIQTTGDRVLAATENRKEELRRAHKAKM